MTNIAKPRNPLPRAVIGLDRGLSPVQRFEQFRWLMSNNADVSSDSPETFSMDATVWQVGKATLLSCRFPELVMERSPKLVRTLDSDRYLLRINRSSPITVDTDGRRVVAGPGQVLLMDASRPETIRTCAGPHLTLSLPREEVAGLLPGNLDLNGLVLKGEVAKMLAGHLLRLEEQLENLSLAEASGVITAAVHLLGASLAPTVNTLGLARPAIEQSLLQQAKGLIERNLRSRELDAEALCAELKVSRSTLYRVFSPLGGVAAYVRERRLAAIHSLLSSRNFEGGRNYLGRIADDFGFSNASHFSRAFRDQFGYSPREARDVVNGPGPKATARQQAQQLAGRYGQWSFSVPDQAIG